MLVLKEYWFLSLLEPNNSNLGCSSTGEMEPGDSDIDSSSAEGTLADHYFQLTLLPLIE